MIKRFKEVSGLYIEKIYGQDRLAFAMSDTSDLYDLVEYARRGGYQGSVIKFYDFENGNVYTPFVKKRDVIYSKPVYTDGLSLSYGLHSKKMVWDTHTVSLDPGLTTSPSSITHCLCTSILVQNLKETMDFTKFLLPIVCTETDKNQK